MSSTQQATTTYRIDPPGSSAEFTSRALFGASTAHGRFDVVGGSAVVAIDRVRVNATLDAASVDTGNARRDTDLRTPRFLDVAAYPELSFTGEGLPTPGGELAGQLTVRGATANVVLHIDAIDGPTVRATARLDRTDFIPGKGGLIGRYVEVALSITLVPAP